MKEIPSKYIFFTKVNGQKIRYLYIPNKQKQVSTVMINGHHANLERIYPLLEYGAKFGSTYCMEPPGFGQSPRFKDKTPSLDNYVGILKDFIEKEVETEKFVLTGSSLGFVLGTLLLQKYPELQDRMPGFIGIIGFVDADAFAFSPTQMKLLKLLTATVKQKRIADFLQRFFFRNRLIMKPLVKRRVINEQYADFPKEIQEKALDFDLMLWRQNDMYTHFYTANEILYLKIEEPQLKVPLYFVYTEQDQYFHNDKLLPSVKKVFPNVKFYPVSLPFHAPRYIDSMDEYKPLIPREVEEFLEKL